MSEIVNPSSNSSGAAQQIIVELIRAGKIGYVNAENAAKEINELYEKLVEGYRKTNSR